MVLGLPAACGETPPRTPEERRAWQGPDNRVSSEGVVTYDRREIAQRVEIPACIFVQETRYGYSEVLGLEATQRLLPALFDTMYRLDRWRLQARPGALTEQSELFVTVLGSTGILGRYSRETACP